MSSAPVAHRLRAAASQVAERVAQSAPAATVARMAYARTMAMPLERSEHRCVGGRVVAVEDVAPWLRRLVVHVPALDGYDVLGPDEYVGLVMPRDGRALPDLSEVSGPNIRSVVAGLDEDVRPDVRWYTVRAWRPSTHELEIEVVLHPAGQVQEGPGATWVRGLEPGAEVAVQTGTTCYHPPSRARVQLIAGDETAYPAIAGIVEAARGTDRELHVLLEVEETGLLPELAGPERGSVTLVERHGRRPGEALTAAVAAMSVPALDYAWVCGEQELAAGVRRHLVGERGLPRTSVYFCAYWILGRARG